MHLPQDGESINLRHEDCGKGLNEPIRFVSG